ncbi:ATP-binding protein [Lyngbya aestuarii]|uniref:ATP-binding protein n=1 Tax=Lyngbya aestuarii TaxID=118322 RepID=UPI00403DCE21
MNIEDFTWKIEEWHSRVAALLPQSDQIPVPGQQQLQEFFGELQVGWEELRVAQEELLRQNEQLQFVQHLLELERCKYRDLFDFAPDAYLVTDDQGIIQEVNQIAAQILQRKQEYLLGKPLSVLMAPEERQNFYLQLNRLERLELRQEWEARLQIAKGKLLDAALSVNPVRDTSGKVVALRWLVRDITERKQAQEQHKLLIREQEARAAAEVQEKRSTFLAEASHLLASSLDYRTTLTRVAQLAVPSLADWCVIDINETNSSNFEEPVVAASDPEQEALVLELRRRYPLLTNSDYGVPKVLRTSKPELVTKVSESVLQFIARDAEHLGILRQLKVNSYIIVPLIAHQRKLGTMALASAQPERCYTQADLTMTEELAERAALAIDNARLYRQLQEANLLKDEFLAIVSHELRTPLNAILGWTHLLLNRKLNETTTTKAYTTIDRNARLQGKLIEDILDISRVIRGKIRLNIRPVQLTRLLDGVIENLKPTAELKGLRVESIYEPLAGQLLGDVERLEQVVWNLISNAIKFTPQGGLIEVQLEQVDSMAQITVRDTGKGITSQFLPFIFERFRQADATTTRNHSGLGLGLAIVRYLVDMHNGSVGVFSEGEGKGATFRIYLPLIVDSSQWQQPTEPTEDIDNYPELEGLRVLVVDDHVDTLELITLVLEQCKAQVTTAASATEALEAIAPSQPEILISDIGMPEKDGYFLISQIRSLEAKQGGQIPAIALTAFAREEEHTRALNAGFQIHLAKPIEPTELVAAVAKLARQK